MELKGLEREKGRKSRKNEPKRRKMERETGEERRGKRKDGKIFRGKKTQIETKRDERMPKKKRIKMS